MGRTEDVSSVLPEDANQPLRLLLHVFWAPERQCLLDADSTLEAKPIPVSDFQLARVHPIRVELERLENVNPRINQARDGSHHRAVRVVNHLDAELVNGLVESHVTRA